MKHGVKETLESFVFSMKITM
jgi:hypothetical protein